MFLGSSVFSAGISIPHFEKYIDNTESNTHYDLVITGGTPGGIMAAIAASRMGKKCLILERTDHMGGLPANGLGATDISTRGATGGLFLEFIHRVKQYYIDHYGPDSPQVLDSSDGYHFEPSVAEKVFLEMIGNEKNIMVLLGYQFDPLPENVTIEADTITSIRVLNRKENTYESFTGKVFIDATYEGDLIAASGISYTVGREGFNVFKEPYAGRVYKYWNGPSAAGSTLLGDNSIQSFNYRLCLTDDPDNRIEVKKPASYSRNDYTSMIEDVKTGRHTGYSYTKLTAKQAELNKKRVENGKPPVVPGMPQGIWRIANLVKLPNGKNDANNQHLAFISTDLPEENWPWPTSAWNWRDRFAQRLKDYTVGLIWFAQNDPELPEWFREQTRPWGLAKDEYVDNDHFPRQVYVREGRRMKGRYFFTANDALPTSEGGRPPLHKSSITASHYSVDSHGVRKREAGRVHLDGYLSYTTQPYTVPYEVIVPEKITNLLSPVPVSGSHLGFSTLRMEPCWMALGQAAGIAASICIANILTVQQLPVNQLQEVLVQNGAVLIYFNDFPASDPDFPLIQYMGLKGVVTSWSVDPEEKISDETARKWAENAGLNIIPDYVPGDTSRRDFLKALYDQMKEL